MNYRLDLEKSVKFIEAQISEKLTPEIIADHVGYSLYHFCRVFQACMGLTVMDYVRQRRLSLAATALFQGGKLIDIALAYGYETPSGFAKAFRKAFGFSPSQFADRMAAVSDYLSGAQPTLPYGGPYMKPVFVTKPAFHVAGYGIQTNITDGGYTKDIAAFWNQFDTHGWVNRMYRQLEPPKHGEVGILVPDSRESGSLVHLLGVIVDDFSKVTPDMLTVTVPEATYAVFTTPPIDATGGPDGDANRNDFPHAIKQTWRYIFEEWFNESGCVYDESKLDFEYYDERCHFRPDTVMDIYVPIDRASLVRKE